MLYITMTISSPRPSPFPILHTSLPDFLGPFPLRIRLTQTFSTHTNHRLQQLKCLVLNIALVVSSRKAILGRYGPLVDLSQIPLQGPPTALQPSPPLLLLKTLQQGAKLYGYSPHGIL